MFEYGAILKGSQTERLSWNMQGLFEYGAILKGSQTYLHPFLYVPGLSMVQF